jgi:CRISPR-associated protein Csb1
MIDALDGAPRVVIRATLRPILGSAFQPTGFPDLGPAEFERPGTDGRSLLVESVQSLANHLEATGWDATQQRPVEAIASLPYVEVRDGEDRFLSSSRLEPHRLAGAYIKEAKLDGSKAGKWMIERFGVKKGVPLDWRGIYAHLFALDPLCLLHGVYFSDSAWTPYGNPKVRRAISAAIEAHDARPIVSGGVKRDDVNPQTDAKEGRETKGGYGFIIFGRTEYTAADIELRAVIDLEQIRGYGLDPSETELLMLLALWELATLLERPLRLRTACDLETIEATASRPDGFALPSCSELERALIASSVRFEEPGARTVRWG